ARNFVRSAVFHTPSGGAMRAVSSRFDCQIQISTQSGVDFRDAAHDVLDPPLHVDSGPLDVRRRPPIASAEPPRARALPGNGIAPGASPLGTGSIAEALRLTQLFLEIRESSPVRVLRARVECGPGVGRRLVAANEIEHVDLPPRLSEQALHVVKPLGILESNRSPLERELPQLAVARKHRQPWRGRGAGAFGWWRNHGLRRAELRSCLLEPPLGEREERFRPDAATKLDRILVVTNGFVYSSE